MDIAAYLGINVDGPRSGSGATGGSSASTSGIPGGARDPDWMALQPVLRRTASAILRRADDIDDAVQEALLRLIRNAGHFDPRKGTREALARVTVRRVALDMLARTSPVYAGREPEPPLAAEPGRVAPVEAAEVRGRLRRAVESLPDPQRVAFLLVHQEGLSHEEAARELGLSQESLRARLYRSRLTLRIALKDLAP